MSLEKSCKDGRIEIGDFCEFLLFTRPRRTHFLDVGDYVVLPCTGVENVLPVEKIAELDSPEKGDFITTRGTIGSVNGSIFIKIDKKGCPEHLLIEGDRIGKTNCPVPVYDQVNKYLKGYNQN